MDDTTHYIEFLSACHAVITDKDCSKYFKRYDPELPRVARMIGILKSINPASLLDIGPGRGRALWPIVYNIPGCEVVCIEPNEWRCRVINAVCKGGVKNVKVVRGDITKASFSSDCFDIVLASEVLEHIPNVIQAMTEIIRVSSKYIIATVPSKPDKNPDHVHYFSQSLFEDLVLKAATLKGKRVERLTFDYVRNSMVILIKLGCGE